MEAAELCAMLSSTAREAGAELRRRFRLPRTIERKGVIDLLTDADRASEAIVLERLARALPDATVVAEESGLRPASGPLRVWVDPLDGTTNYAHGLPHYSVTLAAEDSAGLVAGVVYDPSRDELWSAVRGGGAFRDGERLHVSPTADLGDALLVTGFPYDVRERAAELLPAFAEFLRRARAVRRLGSAALDLAWTAAGRFDGFWEDGLRGWDVAAGALLVAEAGGVVGDWRGGPLRLDSGEVLATTPALRPAMLAVLRGRP